MKEGQKFFALDQSLKGKGNEKKKKRARRKKEREEKKTKDVILVLIMATLETVTLPKILLDIQNVLCQNFEINSKLDISLLYIPLLFSR